MTKKELGEIIKKTRRNSGMTQEDLATRLNLRHSAIGNWERGQTVPNGIIVIKLEEIMGLMTAILEKMKEDKPKPEKTRGRPKKEEKKFMTLGELRKTGFFDS